MKNPLKIADIVITSGGVSVGEADYTKLMLEQLQNQWLRDRIYFSPIFSPVDLVLIPRSEYS